MKVKTQPADTDLAWPFRHAAPRATKEEIINAEAALVYSTRTLDAFDDCDVK